MTSHNIIHDMISCHIPFPWLLLVLVLPMHCLFALSLFVSCMLSRKTVLKMNIIIIGVLKLNVCFMFNLKYFKRNKLILE